MNRVGLSIHQRGRDCVILYAAKGRAALGKRCAANAGWAAMPPERGVSGGMAEWTMAAVLKTVMQALYRGFESHSLRQCIAKLRANSAPKVPTNSHKVPRLFVEQTHQGNDIAAPPLPEAFRRRRSGRGGQRLSMSATAAITPEGVFRGTQPGRMAGQLGVPSYRRRS